MSVLLSVMCVGIVLMLVERRRPARRWPRVSGWVWRALLFNALQVVLILLSGATLDRFAARHGSGLASELGTFAGASVGYLSSTFVYYWWHRWRHEVPLLWRWFHQLHHSPQRIEIITSFYKHPFELVANTLLTSFVLYVALGLTPAAAAGSVLLSGLAELFYHWNVRTPHWLGYIVQRPESHCLHHQSGIHNYNFGDLAVWDILFGTFRNPRHWEATCGLGAANEGRLREMLLGQDLTLSKTQETTR